MKQMLSTFGTGTFLSLLSFLLLAILAFQSVRQVAPPATVAAGAPGTEFSGERAMRHLELIARRPHPAGSPELVEVRGRILGALAQLGVGAELQSTKVVNNILVRLRGTGEGKAVLLVSHYDSVPVSPGAGDDGSAVAAMLETLRALRAGPPLRNDVIFLFSDGEEVGLEGAKAFVYAHPWAKDARVVLNFDARGNGGPVVMFETIGKNGWLIRQLSEAAPRPVATSLGDEIYKLLPHDTDLSIFREAGFAGLNFAFMKGASYYHSPRDTIENLDRRSLQHQGTYALSLARRFGEAELGEVGGEDAVYFNVAGRGLVHYPERWAARLGAAATLLLVGVLALGWRNKHLTPSGVWKGCAAVALNLAGALAAAGLVWWTLNAWRGRTPSEGGEFDGILLVVITCLLSGAIYVWASRKVGALSLLAGTLILWAVLAICTSLFLPGGSYLFTWPLVSGLIAAACVFAVERRETFLGPAALSVGAVPAVLLFAPVVHLSLQAFTLRSAASVVVVALPAVLVLGLLTPHLSLLNSRR
jgi:hypothetical protein